MQIVLSGSLSMLAQLSLSLAQLSPGLYLQLLQSKLGLSLAIFNFRLVSAYQNKFVDETNFYLQRIMLKHYSEISFTNFVDSVLNDFKKYSR